MSERDQFSPGVGQGFYGSGDGTGNLIFPPSGSPSSPLNFTATNSEYTDKILLKWQPSTSALSYKVYKDLNLLTTLSATNLTEDTDGFYSYEDVGSESGKLYTYFVVASNYSGDSQSSNSDTGSRKLNAPTNLTASQNTYNNKINLSWSVVSGASSYKIYRGVAELGDYELLIETSNTSYDDTSVGAGGSYYYYIIATSGLEESDSENSSISTGSVNPNPDTPIITASTGEFTDKVRLTWDTVNFATKYEIYRDNIKIAEVINTTYDDTTASFGVVHSYYVTVADFAVDEDETVVKGKAKVVVTTFIRLQVRFVNAETGQIYIGSGEGETDSSTDWYDDWSESDFDLDEVVAGESKYIKSKIGQIA